jgi:AraC family transcriptional regulator
MVVDGRRQTALPTTPDFISRPSPTDGFFMQVNRLYSFEMPDHWIPFYAVGLQFVEGTGKRFYVQDGRHVALPFENGDSLVISPQELRHYRLEVGECKLLMLGIEPVVFQEMVAGYFSRNPLELTRTYSGEDPRLAELVLKLQAEVMADYPAGPLYAESICMRLAEELIDRYSIGRPRLDRYKGGLPGVQLRRVLEFVDANLDQDLTGNAIAGVAGLSKYHLGKAFRQATGVSLHGYVLARRMRLAEKLLVKSDLPLAGVAEAAGFSNQSHFTSVFSRRIGITPSAYRQMKGRRIIARF